MKKFDKLFGDKKTTSIIYIILAVGILMLAGGNGFVSRNAQSPAPSIAQQKNAAEEKLQEILSEIEGVGEVSVMLCCVEKEESAEEFSSGNKKSAAVSGVLIVANGAQSADVREKIIRATKAALGVESHKIEVLERNG